MRCMLLTSTDKPVKIFLSCVGNEFLHDVVLFVVSCIFTLNSWGLGRRASYYNIWAIIWIKRTYVLRRKPRTNRWIYLTATVCSQNIPFEKGWSSQKFKLEKTRLVIAAWKEPMATEDTQTSFGCRNTMASGTFSMSVHQCIFHWRWGMKRRELFAWKGR